MITRKEILAECPAEFLNSLSDFIDSVEDEVNNAKDELQSIKGIEDLGRVADADAVLSRISSYLY